MSYYVYPSDFLATQASNDVALTVSTGTASATGTAQTALAPGRYKVDILTGNGATLSIGGNSVTSNSLVTTTALVSSVTLSGSKEWSLSYNFGNLGSVGGNPNSAEMLYGNNQYYAVLAEQANVYASTNLVNWTSYAQPTKPQVILYNSTTGVFITGGSINGAGVQTITYSTNGTTWTTRAIPGTQQNWNAGAVGNGYFVMTSGNQVGYSTDGITWSSASNGHTNSGTWAIAYGTQGFVLGNTSGKFSLATDPSSWSSLTVPLSSGTLVYGGAWGNGTYVFNYNNGIVTSTNASTWTTRSNPVSSYNIEDVKFVNGYFIIGGYNSTSVRFAYSTNGINWTVGATITLGTQVIPGSYAYGPAGYAAIIGAANTFYRIYKSAGVDGENSLALSATVEYFNSPTIS